MSKQPELKRWYVLRSRVMDAKQHEQINREYGISKKKLDSVRKYLLFFYCSVVCSCFAHFKFKVLTVYHRKRYRAYAYTIITNRKQKPLKRGSRINYIGSVTEVFPGFQQYNPAVSEPIRLVENDSCSRNALPVHWLSQP